MILLFFIIGLSCRGQPFYESTTMKEKSDIILELKTTKDMLRSTEKKIHCIEMLLKEEESLKCERLFEEIKEEDDG